MKLTPAIIATAEASYETALLQVASTPEGKALVLATNPETLETNAPALVPVSKNIPAELFDALKRATVKVQAQLNA